MNRHLGSSRFSKALTSVAILGACLLAVGSRSPLTASAQGTTYYFNGVAQDQVNRTGGSPTATFNTTAPTGTSDITQFATDPIANETVPANPFIPYWQSTALQGTLNGDMHFDWWWSVENPSDLVFVNSMDVSVFANVDIAAGTGTLIGSATNVPLNASVTPTENSTDVAVNGTNTGILLVQVRQHFVNAGTSNTVHYGSTTAPSNFIFPWVAPTGGTPPAVTVGNQVFASTGNYESPPGYQNRDSLQRPNSGEPSIGADWQTTVTGNNVIMYMAGTQVSKITFNTSTIPPTPTWTDVTPAQMANVSEDSILFTDHAFIDSTPDRTWAENFLVNAVCNANVMSTDAPADGGAGGFASAATAWTQDACPSAEGPDHPSLGAGQYHSPPPAVCSVSCYKHIAYYCSQNILQGGIPGAECTHSENGGQTWDAPTEVFGGGSPCGAIHGHIRLAADGTTYIPQNNCGGGQGMAITQDNGSSYTYAVVPDATPPAANSGTDPSVDTGSDGTVYFGYEDGTSHHPKIAVSQDRGAHWSTSGDVGTPFNITNTKFPEVIAGDGGRAAFAFLGTSCPSTQAGCSAGDQAATFPGVWYLYVAYTYDRGASWQVVNATPNNPVQRGCIWNGGGGNACRNTLDFNDITVDKTGHVYVAYTDGCTVDPTNTYNCNTNPAIVATGCDTTGGGTFSENASEYSTATCTYGRQSALVRQVCGQGLFAAGDPGFTEGPSCASVVTPESPATILLLAGGTLVTGAVAMIARRRRRSTNIA